MTILFWVNKNSNPSSHSQPTTHPSQPASPATTRNRHRSREEKRKRNHDHSDTSPIFITNRARIMWITVWISARAPVNKPANHPGIKFCPTTVPSRYNACTRFSRHSNPLIQFIFCHLSTKIHHPYYYYYFIYLHSI